jgi:glycyl-tRNA synthetase alpha subunit
MSNIYGLVVSSWAAKSSAGNRGFATVVRTSGSESTSANYQLQTSYAPHDVVYEFNPNQSTEGWTPTNVNAAEFGVVVTT